MKTAIDHPFLVPFDRSFSVASAPTEPPKDSPSRADAKKKLAEAVEELSELQDVLYAHDRHALLVIFQALDAAGKDSTVRAVFDGVNPTGIHVTSFKAPNKTELDHDFLWRTSLHLPERGMIGVFNRSYYEEVLVVRVHPHFLDGQQLHDRPQDLAELWEHRYESIRSHEAHLVRNGTLVVKFWLNISKAEQKKRFLKRLDEPEKNWKFNPQDVEERKYWDEYQRAYEAALNATSTPEAPWYAIPADDKPFMRLTVAQILVETLKRQKIEYPKVEAAEMGRFEAARKLLEEE